MWNKLLALNSFVFLPVIGIFMIYSAGRALATLEWKTLIVSVILFSIFLVVEVALALLSD